MGRQTQFGVVVQSINHLIIDVFEWTTVEWCTPVRVCVCVCAHACVCVMCIYNCLLGDNGRLQNLRFCSLKCPVIWFLS